MKTQPALFEAHAIRRVYDEETETKWFLVVDIIQVLTQQPDSGGEELLEGAEESLSQRRQ